MADLGYVRLEIQKGIPVIPGDETYNLESIEDNLNLLSVRGFSVKEDGWIPKLPQVKGGGVYTRNPNKDGSEPIALPIDNVLETITITSTAATPANRYWLEMRLNRLARAARDFWTGGSIQPVYMVWQAPGAPGPQYAQIYDINVAKSTEELVSATARISEITFTVNREPGWTNIVKGENPKHATYIINGIEGSWNSSNASLYSGTDHLVYGTIYNRQEFNTLYTFLTANYIDIPASKIPGDLPALVCIDVEVEDGVGTYDVYIAKTTKRTTITDRAGNSLPLYNALAASGGSMQNATALVADATAGIVHTPASATAKVANPNFATTTELNRITWTVGAALYPHLSPTILEGTYAVFVRAHQTGGAAGICNMRLTLQTTGDFVFFNSGAVTVQLSVTGHSALHYMGTAVIGGDIASKVSARGTGRQAEYDFTAMLYAQRTTATGSAVLNIVDVIFMPIEEGFVQLTPDYYDHASVQPLQHIYDNTGYFAHGEPRAVGTVHGVPGASNNEYSPLAELRGGEIMLEPNVNNRLYFLTMTRSADPPSAGRAYKHDVFINIVPRWSGIRDV